MTDIKYDKIEFKGFIMKATKKLSVIAFLCLCLFGFHTSVDAEEGATGWSEKYIITRDSAGNLIYTMYSDETSNITKSMTFIISEADLNQISEVTFTSSNPSVCSICPGYEKKEFMSGCTYIGEYTTSIKIQPGEAGTAVITAKVGSKEYPVTFINVPANAAKITSITDYNYNSVQLNWNKVEGATSYLIMRARVNGEGIYSSAPMETVQVIEDINTLSTVIKAERNVEYAYFVCPRLTVYGVDYNKKYDTYNQYYFTEQKELDKHTLTFNGAKLTSVHVNGGNIQLNWKPDANVSAYEVYCADCENAPYQLLHTENTASVGSYTATVLAGKTYYFKVVYVYPDDKISTVERSCYAPKNTVKKKVKVKLKQETDSGQYGGGSWSQPDDTYYYNKKGTLHVVCRNNSQLIDYTLNSNLKVSSKKIIKLGKFDQWGGFYYGSDGKYYVAVGYNNKKKSKTKVVIRVKQYSNDWKLLKTCKIKGKSGNAFPGIVYPFDFGNCRMAMCDSSLYLFTSRVMFNGHQSNISFKINIKSMNYKMANEDYTSHSFNQFVKFDNHNLYLSNHGDAYDRGVNLTMVTNYAKSDQKIQTFLPFKIKGKTGDNYTGLEEGGMEVTASHVLIAGTSVPQNYKVAGVSGNKNSYVHNVFLTVVDKTTGKSKVKWLTTYNPKKSKVEVGEVRLVKLSDDYVALLYSTTKKNKSTLHYVVLDEKGDTVYSTTYKDMIFTGGTQPILYDGSIVWSDVKETYNKKNWEYKETTYMYSIPAKIAK